MRNQPLPIHSGIDTSRPSVARVYDYLLGGKDNFAVDREFVQHRLAPANRHLERLVRDNRAFLKRAVRFLVQDAGICQFLDIGTGLPTAENVHEVAQSLVPECRVVYVDNDPVVLNHARALLTSSPEGSTAYIDSDARDIEEILDQAAGLGIDFAAPVAVLFVAILHFLDDDAAQAVTAGFRSTLAPGSHMVLSHAVDRPDFAGVEAAYRESMSVGSLRTPDQIADLFGDWKQVSPGLVALPDWRPGYQEQDADRSAAGLFLGGVARRSS